jgi:hypothetical protein
MAYGKIVADQIQHSSEGTVGTQYVVSGSPKAFVNFNGFGTVAIQESLNMSSVVDNATGDYTPTLATAMNNTDYLCVVGGQFRQRTSSIAIVLQVRSSAENNVADLKTTTQVRHEGKRSDTSSALDIGAGHICVLGDLA